MIDFQLWAFTPGSDSPTILPRPLSWDAGFVLSDVSSMRLTYPIGQPGIEKLAGSCHVEVRYRSGDAWVCPPQGRFRLVDSDVDPVGERTQPARTYTLQSYSSLLRNVQQNQTTGLDAQGNRPFAGQSVGQVIGTLISEAKTAGGVPGLTYLNSAGTGGSSPAYPPGKSVLDLLADARDQGLVEWLVQPDGTGQGRKMVAYSAVGTDRSGGVSPVILREGVDLTAAPSKISRQDVVGDVLVAGDGGRFLRLTNPSADVSEGLLQGYVTAGGLSDVAALQIVGQAALDKGARARAQHTRAIRFESTQFLPWISYSLGDTILAPDESGTLVPLRVRQITLQMQQQGGSAVYSGNLVLGDKFTERSLSLDRRVRQLSGGAGAISGAGRPPTSAADDARQPKAPTGFTVGSTPYTDSDGAYRALGSFGWVNPTQATDGSAMDPGSVEIWARIGTSGTFRRITTADFPATSVEWSPFDAASVWQFRVRAVSVNNRPGPYSATVQATMAKDTDPPNKPSKGTAESLLGTVTVKWDRRDYLGAPMPADWAYTAAFLSSDTGFVPSDATRVGVLNGAGFFVLTAGSALPYNMSRYVKLVAYDRAGNASVPSDALTVVAVPLVDTDLIGRVVSGAKIVPNSVSITDVAIANSVTTRELAALSVTAGTIAANAITVDKIAAGAVTAVKMSVTSLSAIVADLGQVTAGRIVTGNYFTGGSGMLIDASGGFVGIAARNTAGVTTFKVDASTGDTTISGGTFTASTIQTAASGSRVWMDGGGFNVADSSGSYVQLLPGYWRFASKKTYGAASSVYFSSDWGLGSWDSAGNLAFRIDTAGNFTSTGGVITGGTIQTAASGARIFMDSGGFNLVDSGGNPFVQFTASGFFRIGNKTTFGAAGSIYFGSTYGIGAWDGSGTRTLYVGIDGTVSVTGTISASNINTSTINGGTLAGTQVNSGTISGGTYSSGTYSGGSLSGTGGSYSGNVTDLRGAVTGYLYGSGSTGEFRSSSGATRVALSGTSLYFLYSGSVVTTMTAIADGLVMSNIYPDKIASSWTYNNTTTAGGYVTVQSDGRLMRYISSIARKVGVRPLAGWRRALALEPVTWADDDATDGRRTAGFIAEQADRTVPELVQRGDKGWPDGFSYLQLSAYHHAGIQEHDARLAAAEALVIEQAEQITALAARLDALEAS